jgi:hypothetical protein
MCKDYNGKIVGNEEFLIDFTATCYKQHSNSKDCEKVTGIKRTTKPGPPPAPVPRNKWIETSYDFIPKDVLAMLEKYANEVSTLKKSGVALKDAVIYTYGVFRKVTNSGTTYRVDANTSTKSMAKDCGYPFMHQKVQIAVQKAKSGGSLTKIAKDTKLMEIKVADGSVDDEYTGKCLSSPEFKKALAKAKAFAAANSPK